MFNTALEQAKECINNNLTHAEYIAFVKRTNLIEYVETIIIDLDAYQRLQVIMSKEYLK